MTDQEMLVEIGAQEARLVFEDFGHDRALALGQALLARGLAEGLPIAIDISRNGHRLFHAALEGSAPDNAEWIERKKRVVGRFGHSSLYIGCLLRSTGQTLEQKFCVSEREYAAHGGAFPITLEGTGIIDTVAVSGLPQLEDHALVVEVLERHLDL